MGRHRLFAWAVLYICIMVLIVFFPPCLCYSFHTALKYLIMAKEFSKAFYNSEAWDKARRLALSRDNFLCQDCLNNGYITSAEEVHHIIELTPENINDPSITTGLNNLVSLCHVCHTKRHSPSHVKRYSVDDFGVIHISPHQDD